MATSTPTTLSVETRYGTRTFTTCLEWHEVVEELRILRDGGDSFAKSLYEREVANKFLSNSQISWAYKMAQDALDDRNMSTKVKVLNDEKPREVDASNLLASLAEARAKGIKKPTLRLAEPMNGNPIRIKYMSTGRNAGGCWVTSNSDLVGRIGDDGMFTFVGRNYTKKFITEMFDYIELINSDVRGALEAYGKTTNQCGCCGLPLTNKKSIELGIGPICLSKYGLLAVA
jgi:hypothetical protein